MYPAHDGAEPLHYATNSTKRELAVLAVAFAFAHATGEWQAKHRPIIIKAHKRRAQSIFRVGFDLLRKILLAARNEAIHCWRLLIAGQPPRPIRPHGSPQLNRS